MPVRPSIRILAALLLGLSALHGTAQSPSKDMFWEPYLDQPIQQLEEILESLKQQQPMNYTIANISFLYDAKLYILFQKYLTTLPRQRQAAAIKEQNAWLKMRKKAIVNASSEFEGGTLAPFASGRIKIDLTKSASLKWKHN